MENLNKNFSEDVELSAMDADKFKKATITDEQLEEVIKTAKENTPQEVINMRESIDNADQIAEEDFEPEIKDISLDSSFEELITGEEDGLLETDADIFAIANGDIQLSDEAIEARIKDSAEMFNFSDEEMILFMSTLSKYRKKEITNVFPELPASLKKLIIDTAIEQGIPMSEYNHMARMFMDEIIANAEEEEVFVDLEKSLDEALKIPSLADMYSEHTVMVMDEKIPEIIEKIKDTEPENAKLLEDIRDRFHKASSLELLKSHYEENARTRKLIRRDWDQPIKFCDEFNFKNQNSKFKMPDCRSIGPALCKVFLDTEIDPEEAKTNRICQMQIEAIDLNKFAILMCRSCINYNPNDLLDAAYMYYLLKNICMLNLTNETKTSFAGELINNICDIIEFIREKEAEFNASGVSVQQRKQRKRK